MQIFLTENPEENGVNCEGKGKKRSEGGFELMTDASSPHRQKKHLEKSQQETWLFCSAPPRNEIFEGLAGWLVRRRAAAVQSCVSDAGAGIAGHSVSCTARRSLANPLLDRSGRRRRRRREEEDGVKD